MPLDPLLLEILVCPECHGDLAFFEPESFLYCRACHLEYPVRESLPVLIAEDATRLDAAAAGAREAEALARGLLPASGS